MKIDACSKDAVEKESKAKIMRKMVREREREREREINREGESARESLGFKYVSKLRS
jgi:hypothetical protein